LPTKELVFIQSQSNFIEKMLGTGEKFRVRIDCLVAYAPTVKIERRPLHDLELNGRGNLQIFNSMNKFLVLKGPGLVYIDMQAGSRFFKEVQMSLFVVMLYCGLYLLMFLIMTLDKIEN